MNVSDSSGNTPVHLAAALGDADTLEVMRELNPGDFKEAMTTGNNGGQHLIHLACKAGLVEAFNLLLSNLADDQVAQLARDGENGEPTGLAQLAAIHGHLPILEKLIAAGVDVFKGYNDVSLTPLLLAARNGFHDIVASLVEKLEGLHAGGRDSETTTAKQEAQELLRTCVEEGFKEAVYGGHTKIVEFLAPKSKRNLDLDRDYLSSVVSKGRLEVLKALRDAGLSIKLESGYNRLIDDAISYGYPDIVRFLSQEGVGPQRDGAENSLHYAARGSHNLCLYEMLPTVTVNDLRQKNRNGLTPLEAAASVGNIDAFKALLASEERLQSAIDQLPRSPKALSLVIQSPGARSYKTKFVRLLLDLEWQADAPDGGSHIPLHAASAEGQDDLVDMLLNRNANPNARDRSGKTALHHAVNGSTAALLLRRGANPNLVDNGGFAPLHVAAKQGADDIVRLLLGLDEENDDAAVGRVRADVNLKGPQGWTALHYAHTSLAMSCRLLESTPTPGLDNVDEGGVTPLLLAAANGPTMLFTSCWMPGRNQTVLTSKAVLRCTISQAAQTESIRLPSRFFWRRELTQTPRRMMDLVRCTPPSRAATGYLVYCLTRQILTRTLAAATSIPHCKVQPLRGIWILRSVSSRRGPIHRHRGVITALPFTPRFGLATWNSSTPF